jgi:asparaginyl-tRNA synthetase
VILGGGAKIGAGRRRAVFRVQSEVLRCARRFLEARGFLEVLSPVFEPYTDTGIGDAGFFEIDYYGRRFKLMSALTIHKPVLVTQLGNIFSFTPCSRREPASYSPAKRHLSQFYQIEVEMEGDCQEAMDILERLTKHVIDGVRTSCKIELEILDTILPSPSLPFNRLRYKEAVNAAKNMGVNFNPEAGLSWEAEEEISRHIEGPLFITNFPTGLAEDRGILYKVAGEYLMDFDLVMPNGHGEVSSGSEREVEYEDILRKIKPDQRDSFKPYLEVIKRGVRHTSGFGVGVERLTKYICDLENISEASLFPKVPGTQ